MTTPTLYDMLGVRRDATFDEVRAAYLARARLLHPDRLIDADDEERARAQRDMQSLNEAFRILGHDERRREYDRELADVRAGRAGERSHGIRDDVRGDTSVDGDDDQDDGDIDAVHGAADPLVRLVRALPWILILAVLFAIFVFTAYAGDRP